MKTFLVLFALLLALTLVQCTDNSVVPVQDEFVTKGPGSGGSPGGGGHTEIATNNLSFPALLADGFSLTPVTASFTTPYTGPYDGLTPTEVTVLESTGPWYAQKVEGNIWQAEYAPYNSTYSVAFIDWGDAMESVDPKLRRPYRVEFGVYVQLAAPMSAYTMALLAYPSSPDETQGTNMTRYDCNYATIASPTGTLVIQRYEPGATLTWNAAEGKWDGAYEPESGFGFAQELNVGGKYIFGASTGGWKPTIAGEYRITFYLKGSEVSFAGAQIGDYNDGVPEVPKIVENNEAVVDVINNLTYIDVTAGGTGGGGGH